VAEEASGETTLMNIVSVPVIELRAVSHRYGDVSALRDVTVAIPAGCMVGLIGPDGVGKSTLLALAAGVRRIQGGVVTVLGGDMGDLTHRRSVLPRIAYVPQGLGRSLYPTLSVTENISFFGRMYRQPKAKQRRRITRLLSATGLDTVPDRPADKLSGGMKQKLALCCALSHDPDLLILDEPTTGVDALSRRQFWELIERIREEQPDMSVLTATAYMSEAESFDHLIAMESGGILAVGSPEGVKRRTNCNTLEAAFIALLPEAKRSRHHEVVVPPRLARSAESAIEAGGLTMRFGKFVAVDNVSMRIDRGEIFGFLGPNGCGKTTTMKMLTGLLQPTAGEARLFGRRIAANSLETRARVGYMSQSFSLYAELTVRQNLQLHAHLFHLSTERVKQRVAEMLSRFGLDHVAEVLPHSLPLGVRQRLQLAVAIIHGPDLLILDEPTSGVDPIARDTFWEYLVALSRADGVTIFISTHFVHEAERCDRVSLMHEGRILAIGAPEELRKACNASSLEDAFIGYLEDAGGTRSGARPLDNGERAGAVERQDPQNCHCSSWLSRVWTFTWRETLELVRDPTRLAFALLGPVILLLAMAYGISFDIEKVRYAALDQDRSQESMTFLDSFANSRYFNVRPPIASERELDRRLRSGELRFALIVPPGFGRDLLAGRNPEVGVWLDGSNTFRAETSRGYVQGVLGSYLAEVAQRETGTTLNVYPAQIETRFRYNQAFLSVYAIAPGVLMMQLVMFSAMLTALGVVREKELGSIVNFFSSPATKIEFLVGKQLPYVAIALMTFVDLVLIIRFGFHVPLKGSVLALTLGALIYTAACSAFGLVISAFVRSQIAAIFASAIIVMIPTVNFSGMIYPISTLEGGARVIGELFPALYFQRISAGAFSKGLGLSDLYQNHIALMVLFLSFLLLAALLLRKQEG
jgi:ribosome-dependent ATPase